MATALFMLSCAAEAGHTLSTAHTTVLEAWLGDHQELRQATVDDCECAEDIDRMRRGTGGEWLPIKDYEPYVAVGDFNDDDDEDFAVVVVNAGRQTRPFSLVVFNGPHDTTVAAPSFVSADMDLVRQGLFFGAPRPEPHRLLVGPFESEAIFTLVPDGSTYRLEAVR